ncbi:MAG: InlB B-repeat-containing protein [Treponema sp.]|jgi:uncharacterized repeat protein (TIGR02543 family)|nr:InlB B-repeat-containing protein [Treponema sp.]
MKFSKFFLIALLLASIFMLNSCGDLFKPKMFTVTYDANGADGGTVPASASYEEGSHVFSALNTGNLTKTGYSFYGWNTKPDGSGESHSLYIYENVVFYAQWSKLATYTVTYAKGYASGGTVPEAQSYPINTEIEIADNIGNLTRTDYTFSHWNTSMYGSDDDYYPGQLVTITEDLTLYPAWETGPIPEYTLTYDKNDADGGTVPEAESYKRNTYADISGNTGNLTRTGYVFDRWNSKADGTGTNYTLGSRIQMTEDTTLYAKWTKVYTISYDKNGADGGTVPDPRTYKEGDTVYSSQIAGNTGNLIKDAYLFDSWNTESDGSGENYSTSFSSFKITEDIILYAQWDAVKNFWAQKVTDNTYYEIDAVLLAEGDHSLIYADATYSFSQVNAESIRDEFEADIYPTITGTFGNFEDIDENGKVTILLLDIIDGYNSVTGGGYVAGYFAPGDMESKINHPNSNEADMLYIDVNPGWSSANRTMLYTTIAHELQHGINYSRTVNGKPEQDLWITEGLSSAAEYVYSGYQDDRIDYFNADPSGTIGHGNNFYVWNGFWELGEGGPYDSLANYSTVYLFFQWLRVHASNDTGIYKNIIDSQYGNYQAVTSAAGGLIDDQFNDWETLLSTWMWANIRDSSSGYEGYKGISDLSPVWYEVHAYYDSEGPLLTSWPLFPGEGLFAVKLSEEDFAPSGTEAFIKYYNQTCLPTFIDDYRPIYNTYLTVNVNTDITASYEEGQIAANVGTAASRISSSRFSNVRTSADPLTPYPVSFADKQRELEAKKNQGGRTSAADLREYNR